jgi:hypothetical protein
MATEEWPREIKNCFIAWNEAQNRRNAMLLHML